MLSIMNHQDHSIILVIIVMSNDALKFSL
jgi:hypothetical protein